MRMLIADFVELSCLAAFLTGVACMAHPAFGLWVG